MKMFLIYFRFLQIHLSQLLKKAIRTYWYLPEALKLFTVLK
jgi:hypothetical protein